MFFKWIIFNRYAKVFNSKHAENVNKQITNFLNYPISVIIFNFVDMLSHARTDNLMIRELVSDEKAYRSITKSWVANSPFLDLFKNLSEKKVDVFLTTDHGSIKVYNPVKVVGDRSTSTNLRYKQGKHLSYPAKEVYEILTPHEYNLPKPHLTSTYIFAKENDFFAYPNNYNYYVKYYKDTFQHGGISLEEMLIPFVHLVAK
ncbi:MAG TPA: PglZ domain-containing protein [Bacteroidales bacterium]|nr:PglZ domain-containing protein [Bacteroidales bacterium]